MLKQNGMSTMTLTEKKPGEKTNLEEGSFLELQVEYQRLFRKALL